MKSPLLGASLVIVGLTVAAMASAQDSAPRSLDLILGSYNSPVVLSAGKVVRWNHEVLIENDHFLMKRRGSGTNGETWSYTLDSSKDPKHITMIRTAGLPDIETGKPHQINAIYEQTEKEIRIAFLPGRNGSSLEERPKDMTSTDANKAIVMILTPKDSSIEESRRTNKD